jgi:uncharacterized protein YqjF (DUF2071 family)
MLHRWAQASFLHWPYRPEVVQRLLPAGLEVDTLDGRAWVGLVPFRMARVRAPGLPPAPWLSAFPETNVRTYVRGPDGQAAIWFLSLDAARLGAVLGARATYLLPYFWARMRVEVGGGLVRYRGRRRWPGPRGAGYVAAVEVGRALDEGELGALDHFLTARHVLWTVIAGRLASAHAEHGPWPLARARLIALEQDLIQAGRLPAPHGPPLVHHSAGVDVRIGAWRWVRG